ncbi:MAG TPA: 23S rRNA (guanosine(2251)-2'-O)-methyltransferase RlmB [Thermoanaerobacterales bacterium]|nr:23S rRNA (guanosine(2251)-2'-O)-methyltransferase RlmB [Thermoanaerobacterales bacterium]
MTDQIEGRNPVLEALKAKTPINRIIIEKGEKRGSILEIISMAKDLGIPIKELDKKHLDKISKTYNHQGIIAETAEYKYSEIEDLLEKADKRREDALLVILDGIEDPYNLGSIIRTSDAVGAHGIVIPKRRSASVTPLVIKSSAGAAAHVPVARETNLNRTVEMLKEKGLWIAGADMEGTSIYETDLKGPLALVIGGEGKGISRLLKEKCDFLVSIPMVGEISSLNAATAAAIILYEIFRQRSSKQGAVP